MDFMITKLLGFTLVLTRLSAFFLIAPVFSWKSIPNLIKVSIVFLLAIFFTSLSPAIANADQVEWLEAILMMSNEAMYGFAMGLTAAMIFSVVRLAGRIIERQMGFAMAEILDPMTGEGAQPLGLLLEVLFILLFLSANGHQLLLMIASKSYEIFPAGKSPTVPVLTEGIVQTGQAMLIAALRLSAPILAAFLLLLVVLGVFARIMPDMNILFISMPLRVGMGLLMVGIFLPFLSGFITEFADWMGKLLPI
jgi:flagellar biosynthetic protein FliR